MSLQFGKWRNNVISIGNLQCPVRNHRSAHTNKIIIIIFKIMKQIMKTMFYIDVSL